MAKGIGVNLNEWFKLIPQTKVKNYFFRNNGSLRFENYTDNWNDAPASFSNSAVYADLDNDGDLEVIVSNMDDPAFILKNNAREMNGSNFLRFRFLKNKNSPVNVYDVAVKIFGANGIEQVQRFQPQRGYMGSMEHFLHFGIGKETVAQLIEITFPSGKQINLTNVAANQVYNVYESDASADFPPAPKVPELLTQSNNAFKYTHVENDFIDFKREPLIPYKCSRKGPFYAMADVNGDGREDIFVGGPTGVEGKLMLQAPDGSFAEKKVPAFITDKAFEDNGVLFFDADGDKDNDLYIVSGGAEFDAGSPKYHDRLYINDGKGNFTRSTTSLPKETSNGSYVISLDFDDDGDLDLFVGGGVLPGKFPKCDKSFLLQNNKGVFKDVTATLAPELSNIGIVTYAAWEDMDGDKKKDLIVTGEWMSPSFLSTRTGIFAKVGSSVSVNGTTIPLHHLTGWWNTVKTADIDNDGDLDVLLGNRGLNSRITASLDEPCTIYAKDFDNNGSYDAVLGYYTWGKLRPLFHRDQLIDQMPFIRKKYLRYRHYADQGLDDIFSAEQKKGMDIFKTAFFESGMLINDGNYNFRFIKFPEKAQLSLINDLIVEDFDKDGKKDLLIVGNSYDPDVTTGNYDATAAMLFKNNGDFFNLSPVPPAESGLHVRGEVRRVIYQKDKNRLILLKNNATAQVFE
jgi:enediyne biosynthesis protein E4